MTITLRCSLPSMISQSIYLQLKKLKIWQIVRTSHRPLHHKEKHNATRCAFLYGDPSIGANSSKLKNSFGHRFGIESRFSLYGIRFALWHRQGRILLRLDSIRSRCERFNARLRCDFIFQRLHTKTLAPESDTQVFLFLRIIIIKTFTSNYKIKRSDWIS